MASESRQSLTWKGKEKRKNRYLIWRQEYVVVCDGEKKALISRSISEWRRRQRCKTRWWLWLIELVDSEISLEYLRPRWHFHPSVNRQQMQTSSSNRNLTLVWHCSQRHFDEWRHSAYWIRFRCFDGSIQYEINASDFSTWAICIASAFIWQTESLFFFFFFFFHFDSKNVELGYNPSKNAFRNEMKSPPNTKIDIILSHK